MKFTLKESKREPKGWSLLTGLCSNFIEGLTRERNTPTRRYGIQSGRGVKKGITEASIGSDYSGNINDQAPNIAVPVASPDS